jgi:hypothetical protein
MDMSKPYKESTLREDSVPKDELAFTEYVAARLRRELGDVAIVVKHPLMLQVGDDYDSPVYLHRIFDFCNRNPTGCWQELSAHVTNVARGYKDQFAPTKADICIAVRSRKHIDAFSRGGPKVLVRELAGDLVMVPVFHMPGVIRLLTDKDHRTLDLSTDEIFELGFANLRTRLRPLTEVAECPAGQIGVLCNDKFESCRLALLDSWSPLASAQGGKLIVAAPATDTVLFMGEDTPTAINALRTGAEGMVTAVPNPLSGELFRWTPKRWEVVHSGYLN